MFDISGFKRVEPGRRQRRTVAAQLPYMTAERYSVENTALAAGMHDRGDHFIADDGSWVALVGSRVERGQGRKVFSTIPGNSTRTSSSPSTRPSASPREPRGLFPLRPRAPLPDCMQGPFIGAGDISRALILCDKDVETMKRWVSKSRAPITINARATLQSYDISVPRRRRADI